MNPSYRQRYTQEDVQSTAFDDQLIYRLLHYLYSDRWKVCIGLIMLFISRGIEAWIPIKLGQVAQEIIAYGSKSLSEQNLFFHHVVMVCLLLVGWVIFGFILDILNIVIKNWVGQKALFKLRMQVYERIQHFSMSYYDQSAIGRLMTRTIHDVDQINQLFSESVIPLAGSLFLFICMFIGMVFLNWQVALLMTLFLPMIWGFTRYFRSSQRESYQAIRSIVSAMNTFVQEHLMGASIVKGFGLHATEKEKFDEINQDHYTANIETIHQFALFFSGIEWMQNLTMISVFALLVYFTPMGSGFEVGTYLTVNLYTLMIFRPLADLAERYNILQSALAASERIFDVLDTPLEEKGPQPGLKLTTIDSIVFENVWFAYQQEEWVLQGLSFSLKKGESIALVGTTGSGKTTIMQLLLRFYSYQKGNIWINGYSITDYAVENLRQQFSVIWQDPVIFSGTVADNIALYDPSLTLTQLWQSTDDVYLSPLIERLPKQMETVLSERGTQLSAGQMQLIALARAVVHHRPVIIFDEATSHIDSQTEKLIQQALQHMLKHKTALVIAHRLSTIQDLKRIPVLVDGVVAEEGSHQELLQQKGIYETLYRLQTTSSML